MKTKTIYVVYPYLKDATRFHVTTSKLAATKYLNEECEIEGPFENLLLAGFIVERQPVEVIK